MNASQQAKQGEVGDRHNKEATGDAQQLFSNPLFRVALAYRPRLPHK